jgi:hypothetical protein
MEAHQLFATLFGAVAGLDEHQGWPRADGALHLRRPQRQRAGAAHQPQMIEAAPRQERFGAVGEVGGNPHLHFESARESALALSLLDACAVGAKPRAAARQFGGDVRHDGAIRREREADELRVG